MRILHLYARQRLTELGLLIAHLLLIASRERGCQSKALSSNSRECGSPYARLAPDIHPHGSWAGVVRASPPAAQSPPGLCDDMQRSGEGRVGADFYDMS